MTNALDPIMNYINKLQHERVELKQLVKELLMELRLKDGENNNELIARAQKAIQSESETV